MRDSVIVGAAVGIAAATASCGASEELGSDPRSAITAPASLRPDGSECGGDADERVLLTLDLDGPKRVDLERAMAHHIAVVRFGSDGLRVLRDCAFQGAYDYATFAEAHALTRTFQDERGRTIDVRYVTVGARRAAPDRSVPAQLVGSCRDATHFVRAASVGAFSGSVTEERTAPTTAANFGASASASNGSATSVRIGGGDLEACRDAGASPQQPPDKCNAVVIVCLARIRTPTSMLPARR